MNEQKEWEKLLQTTNESLKGKGFSINIKADDEGYYSCEILKDGEPFYEDYADGYREDELEELINEAVADIHEETEGNIEWLETEYCGKADETVQPVLINGNVWYAYYSPHGYHYLFDTIYKLHLHWSGVSNQYFAICENEEELNDVVEQLANA